MLASNKCCIASLHSDSMTSYILAFYACLLYNLLSKHGKVVVYSIKDIHYTFMVGQQHIQAEHTGIYMLASIKKSGSIHTMACLRILLEQDKLRVVYAVLLALIASPANKCHQKFHPG